MSLANSIFREAVKSVLVNMTIEGELPMDMNSLDIDSVFEKAEEMVKDDEDYKVAQAYDKADEILVPDDENDVISQVNVIREEFERDPNGMIDYIDGVEPISHFQYSFTNRDFLVHIGLINK